MYEVQKHEGDQILAISQNERRTAQWLWMLLRLGYGGFTATHHPALEYRDFLVHFL